MQVLNDFFLLTLVISQIKINFMKKNLLLLILICSVVTVGAQISKNKILLGGQLGYSSDDYSYQPMGQKSNAGVFGLSIGKAFKENKVWGINISFSGYKTTDQQNASDIINSKVSNTSIGIFYRAYKKLSKELYFFGEAEAGYINTYSETYYRVANNTVKYKGNGGFASFTPGLAYKAFKKMYLELTIPSLINIRYSTTNITQTAPQNNYTNHSFGFNTNLSNISNLGSLSVGVRFLL